MFKVVKNQWDALTPADQAFIRRWRKKEYPRMDTHAEIITLPSGNEFEAYYDGRGFVRVCEWDTTKYFKGA